MLPTQPTSSWALTRTEAILFGSLVVLFSSFVVFAYSYRYLKKIGAFKIDAQVVQAALQEPIPDNTLFFDRSGQIIKETYARSQIFTPLAEVPAIMVQAVLALEDRRFYRHSGIDLRGIARATWRTFVSKKTEGGSTLTQQIARAKFLYPDKTFDRKILEMIYARTIEKSFTKEQILEHYLNNMFLGYGTYGIAAAAERYFGKKLPELTLLECAIIAGIFQAPSRLNPIASREAALERGRVGLRALYETRVIDLQTFSQWSNATPDYPVRKKTVDVAPYFIDHVKNEALKILGEKTLTGKGFRIYTTLDIPTQSALDTSFDNSAAHFQSLEKDLSAKMKANADELQAAALITDPRTGEILALRGGRNYEASPFNRAVSSLRSPGSAFKPIVFAEAMRRGYAWNQVFFVAPQNVDNYRPKNFSEDYMTESTLFRALYKSQNSVTIELTKSLGVDSIVQMAKKMGVTSTLKREMGIGLGSSSVTMLDMARVYGTIAAEGEVHQMHVVRKILSRDGRVLYSIPDEPKVRALTPIEAHLLTEGLRGVLRFGTATMASEISPFAAGKTGTSNNATDSWFCGFTKSRVIVTWVGTDKNSPLSEQVTGASAALPLWLKIYRAFEARKSWESLGPFDDVAYVKVDPAKGTPTERGLSMPFTFEKARSLTKSGKSVTLTTGKKRNAFKK